LTEKEVWRKVLKMIKEEDKSRKEWLMTEEKVWSKILETPAINNLIDRKIFKNLKPAFISKIESQVSNQVLKKFEVKKN